MVSQLSTKQEQTELRKTFNLFDTNGDGKIELAEFIQSYRKVYPDMQEKDVV